jgi:hypothetical protein
MKIKTKHCRFIATILVVTVILLGAYASNKDKAKNAYLTCDYQTNPLSTCIHNNKESPIGIG